MKAAFPTLLIVDDEKSQRDGLRTALEESFDVFTASGSSEALRILEAETIDLVLTDLFLAGDSGMDLLQSIQKLPKVPIVIMMTAYGSVDTAVKAMQLGAWDFVTKPINLDEVELLLKRALKQQNLEKRVEELQQEVHGKQEIRKIIGQSSAIQRVTTWIQQVAPTRATVLIEGESGTGKEIVAQAIHELSGRNTRPMITVNCAALSPQLLESELFGHEKGAFTGALQRRIGRFEQANESTLFLDEIGEIDASTQVKLLRVLSERNFERVGGNTPIPVDVRIIAATNRNLQEMVANGEFREDLFFRLNVVYTYLPPLREREGDVILLAGAFLREFAKENQRSYKPLSDDALQLIQSYPWPGNIRELRAAIEHGVIMSNTSQIEPKHFPESFFQRAIPKPRDEKSHDIQQNTKINLADSKILNLHQLETAAIQAALQQAQGNRTLAAKYLGISRRTLLRKLASPDSTSPL